MSRPPDEEATDMTDGLSTSAQNSPTGRYKKNFMKHSRRASESTVEESKELETKKSEYFCFIQEYCSVIRQFSYIISI